jgi:hypothetical protein
MNFDFEPSQPRRDTLSYDECNSGIVGKCISGQQHCLLLFGMNADRNMRALILGEASYCGPGVLWNHSRMAGYGPTPKRLTALDISGH